MNKAVITIVEHDERGAEIRLEFEGNKDSVTFALSQFAVHVMKKDVEESGADVQTTTREQYVNRVDETTH